MSRRRDIDAAALALGAAVFFTAAPVWPATTGGTGAPADRAKARSTAAPAQVEGAKGGARKGTPGRDGGGKPAKAERAGQGAKAERLAPPNKSTRPPKPAKPAGSAKPAKAAASNRPGPSARPAQSAKGNKSAPVVREAREARDTRDTRDTREFSGAPGTEGLRPAKAAPADRPNRARILVASTSSAVVGETLAAAQRPRPSRSMGPSPVGETPASEAALAARTGSPSPSGRTPASPATPPPAEPDEPGNLLLFDVAVERTMVASAMTTYQIGKAIFVPMGELARVLTLSVRVDPARKRASGFILTEERSFVLDAAANRVVMSGRTEAVDPSALRVLEDDIYIDTALLENWWPVRLRPDRSRLVLDVQPREPLPLQLRLARERAAAMIGRAGPKSGDLPRTGIPYRMATWPAIDQTLAFTAGRSRTDRSWGMASTSYLTGDLLGLEAAAYANLNASMAGPAGTPATRDSTFRMTLGRSDPQGKALGPLPSTSFSLGNVLMPGVNHVFRTSTAGPGFTVSNLPLERGTNFSSTSFQGALPPGWDVELFFNDALVGYQQSRADGTYSFNDLPLIFGENRFRLVFHGPQGQTRVETRNYNLDSSTVRPGEVLYTLGAHRDAGGSDRGLVQLEYGLDKRLSAYGGLVVAPPQAGLAGRQFANGGVRAFLDGWLLSTDLVHCTSCSKGSNLYAFGFNRRLEYGTLTGSHALLDNFTSELYPSGPDPIRASTKGRLDATLPVPEGRPVPVTAQLQVDSRRSGMSDVFLSARATHAWNGSTVTHELAAQSQSGQQAVLGGLQLSRQLAGMSLRGQMLYRIDPDSRVDTGLVSADWNLKGGQLLNVSAVHRFQLRDTSLSLTLNRNLGTYSVRAGLSRSTSGATTAGLQFFTSAARDPGSERWMFASLPGANSGAASARVFLDRNLSGTFDAGDEPITGASFFVNGTGAPVRTDASGLAYLPRLTPYRVTGVSLNPSSLEDSQWSPGVPGLSFMPRAGRIANLEFPVVVTAEIDGYVQLETDGQRRGVSDVQLELYGSDGAMALRVRSTADGYFLISGVKPGRYTLRVAEEQIRRLMLQPVQALAVDVSPDGHVANGYDFVLRKASAAGR
jgi:hypothetical protein